MKYYYDNMVIVPNLDQLTVEILASLMTNKSLISLRWEQNTRQLSTDFEIELSIEDKIILDSIVLGHDPDFSINQFNLNLFFYRFAQEFDAIQRLQFSRLAPSFTAELQFLNFTEVKQLRDYLVSEGSLSQIDADKITSLFAEQNINLDEF